MFLPLNVQSAYTFLESPLDLKRYVRTAKKYGYQSLALADHNHLQGIPEFIALTRQENIKPILGMWAEFPSPIHPSLSESWLIFSRTYKGFQDLMTFSSLLLEEDEIDGKRMREFLVKEHEWFLIASGENSALLNALKQGQNDEAKNLMIDLRKNYGPYFLVGKEGTEIEAYYQESLQNLCQTYQIQTLPTPKLSFIDNEDRETWRMLKAIHDNSAYEEVPLPLNQNLLPPKEENHQQDIFDWMMTQINVQFPEVRQHLPKFPTPKAQSAQDYLKERVKIGLAQRLPQADERYIERLNHELTIIHDMGFDDYFLIVWDVIHYAKTHHIMTGPGRGSAAGSLVAYVLEITDIDPLSYDLLFERFLNPERQTMPDIDLDFPDNRRQEIVDYVYNKYGKSHVSQIATIGTFGPKQALRDVGRMLKATKEDLKAWSDGAKEIQNSLSEVEENKDWQRRIQQTPNGSLWFKLASRIEGLPRITGTHSAGVLICEEPLVNFTPLQKAKTQGIHQSQWTKDVVEGLGLLKIDFLSLSNLTLLDYISTEAKRLKLTTMDPRDFDRQDPEVFKLFASGKTLGIFQFESSGIRRMLKQLKPTSYEDISAANALYRPGPMKQISHFIARKHGKETITLPHPILENILDETYGIMVYQEQVMRVVQKIAGFTLGQADSLRRVISKKDKNKMEEMRQRFVEGAKTKGYDLEVSEKIFNYIDEFADYGFNKSHSFAYGLLAYELAYYKVHYPSAFYAGALRQSRSFTPKGKAYIEEAKELGLTFQTPDVQEYLPYTHAKDKQTIILGLTSIKGLPPELMRHLIQERYQKSYSSLSDFCSRLPKRYAKVETLKPLIFSGALDSFGETRRTLNETALSALLTGQALFQMEEGNLFSSILTENYAPMYESLEEYDKKFLIQGEMETLGLGVSLQRFSSYLPYYLIDQLTYSDHLSPNRTVEMIGEVIEVKRIQTKNGFPMAFIKVMDDHGIFEVTAFTELYVEYARWLKEGKEIYLLGKTQVRNQSIQVILQRVENLQESQQLAPLIKISVENRQQANEKKKDFLHLTKDFSGNSPVYFEMREEKVGSWLNKKYRLRLDPSLVHQLNQIYGEKNVKISTRVDKK